MKAITGKELGGKLLASVKQMKVAPVRKTKIEPLAAAKARMSADHLQAKFGADEYVDAIATRLGTGRQKKAR